MYDVNEPGELQRARRSAREILELCVALGGTITGEHGVGIEKIDDVRAVRRARTRAVSRGEARLRPAGPAQSRQGRAHAHALRGVRAACTCTAARSRTPNCRAILAMEPRIAKLAERRSGAAAAQRQRRSPIRGGGTQGLLRPSGRRRGTRHGRADRGIVEYEPTELVITARAGTPLAEIEARWLASRPDARLRAAAFRRRGHASAARGRGGSPGRGAPRRCGARLRARGAHARTGAANISRFGGSVIKNVAGYDVSRLMCRRARHAGRASPRSRSRCCRCRRAEITLRARVDRRGGDRDS